MADLSPLSVLLFGNSLLTWLTAAALAAAALLALLSARKFIRGYYSRLQATPQTELLEIPVGVLSRTTMLTFVVLAIFAGMQVLTYGPAAGRILSSAVTISLFWQCGGWGVAAVGAWLERRRRRSMSTDLAAAGSLSVIGFILNVVIWSLVALLTLENLGVDITALVAGLGIGGVAVALALQNILGDLFASLSITLDRPFVLGDFLIVDDVIGSVEFIGIKSTRLRSLSGEQIIMSNSDLLKSRVRNYGRMKERRVVFASSITYETPLALIEKVPDIIRKLIEAQQGTRFDRSHFQKHGAASLDFETVYYVLSADFNRYMDIQQAINIGLHRQFEELGIEFAYPTQKLFVAQRSQRFHPPAPMADEPGLLSTEVRIDISRE